MGGGGGCYGHFLKFYLEAEIMSFSAKKAAIFILAMWLHCWKLKLEATGP